MRPQYVCYLQVSTFFGHVLTPDNNNIDLFFMCCYQNNKYTATSSRYCNQNYVKKKTKSDDE